MATQTPTTATAPLGSTARTNQLLAEGAKQGLGAAPTFNIDSPATVAANVSKGLSTPQNPGGNPLDAPGAVPQAQPGKNLDGSPIGSKPNASVPSPQNPTPPMATGGTGTPQATQLGPNDQVPQGLADQVGQVQSGVDQLAQSHKQALADLNKSGVAAPSSQGSGTTGVQTALNNQPQATQQPQLPPSVEAIFGGTDTPIAQQVQSLQDLISPPAQKQALKDAMDSLSADKQYLSGLKIQEMNIKNVMAGTSDDIANEVQAAGGTITQSLLANMTVGRNKVLLQQSAQLSEQIQMAQDAVNTDTTLVGDEKTIAAQEATQRMGILNFVKSNYDNNLKAAQTSLTEMQKTEGWTGIYQAALASGDPQAIAKINSTMGTGFDIATAAKNDTTAAMNQADLAAKRATTANIATDNARANAALAETIRHDKADEANSANKTGVTYSPAQKDTLIGVGMTGSQVDQTSQYINQFGVQAFFTSNPSLDSKTKSAINKLYGTNY